MLKALHATDVRPIGWELWGRWVLVHVVAGIAGWSLSAAAAMFTCGAGILFAGLMVGIVLGGGQGLVLQPYMQSWSPSRFWLIRLVFLARTERILFWHGWLLCSVVGAVPGWWLSGLLISLMRRPFVVQPSMIWLLAFLLPGAIVGALQWVILRRQSQHAIWWIAVNAIAWSTGAAIGAYAGDGVYRAIAPENIPYYFEGFWIKEAIQLAVSGSVGTMFAAFITGIGLVWLLRHPITPSPNLISPFS